MTRPRLKRLLRISLRTLLVLTTILCSWLGFKVYRVDQQKKAVEWVTEVGGTVGYDYETENPFAPSLPGPDWLCNLIGVDYFAKVDAVSFPPDLADVSPLTNLSNVRYLELNDTQVSDLTPLAKLAKLKYLVLWETPVKDLSPLSNLTKLEELYLNNCTQVSDLSPLENLTRLEYLSLINTAVTDVSALTRLTNLKELDLRGTRVSKEDVGKLREVLPNCVILLWPFQFQ